MANGQWNFTTPLSRLTLSRAEAVNAIFQAIADGFDAGMSKSEIQDEIAAINLNISSTALATLNSANSYADGLAFATALPNQTGNAGKFVTTDGTNAMWATVTLPQVASQSEAQEGADNTKIMSPLRVREARLMRTNAQSSGYTVVAADFAQMLAVSGTVTLALTAAATLGDGFYCYVRNTGSGVVTINPNGAETIDGAATLAVSPGAEVRVHCNGTLFRTSGKFGFEKIGGLVTVPGGTSAIDITTASLFNKTYEEIVVEFERLKGSSANQNLQLSRRSAGAWGAFYSGRTVMFFGSSTNITTPPTIGVMDSAGIGTTGELRVSGMGTGRYPQIKFSALGDYSGAAVCSEGVFIDGPGIDGLRFSPSDGSFNSGYYQLYGKRAS